MAFAPVLPLTDFDQPNFFTTDLPEMVKVRSIVPFITLAPPSVPFAAKVRTTEPEALAVAAVLDLVVTPDGRVPTAHVHAVCVMPIYPTNGMVTSTADCTRPPFVQAMVCDSLPRMTERPPVPVSPLSPAAPVSPFAPS